MMTDRRTRQAQQQRRIADYAACLRARLRRGPPTIDRAALAAQAEAKNKARCRKAALKGWRTRARKANEAKSK